MNRESNGVPVACSLPDAELREREATLFVQFMSGVIAIEELPDGYVFRLPGDEKWIAVATALIVAERECCPFLTFALAFPPNMGPVDVRVTGPAGTKDFLRTVLSKPERPV
jgi:hypothetical protein